VVILLDRFLMLPRRDDIRTAVYEVLKEPMRSL